MIERYNIFIHNKHKFSLTHASTKQEESEMRCRRVTWTHSHFIHLTHSMYLGFGSSRLGWIVFLTHTNAISGYHKLPQYYTFLLRSAVTLHIQVCQFIPQNFPSPTISLSIEWHYTQFISAVIISKFYYITEKVVSLEHFLFSYFNSQAAL